MNEGVGGAKRNIPELARAGRGEDMGRRWKGLVSQRLLGSDGSLGGRKQSVVTHEGVGGTITPHFLLSYILSSWLMPLLDQTPNRTETKKTHMVWSMDQCLRQ